MSYPGNDLTQVLKEVTIQVWWGLLVGLGIPITQYSEAPSGYIPHHHFLFPRLHAVTF